MFRGFFVAASLSGVADRVAEGGDGSGDKKGDRQRSNGRSVPRLGPARFSIAAEALRPDIVIEVLRLSPL